MFYAIHIPEIEINAEADAFMERDDPGLTAYFDARESWGWDEYATICVSGDDWFTPAGIERLNSIKADFLAIKGVSSVLSVLDVPLLRQRPDQKPKLLKLREETSSLLEPDVDLVAAREELKTHELARGNLISADARSLNILVYMSFQMDASKESRDIVEQRHAIVKQIREVVSEWQPKIADPIRISGLPVINVTMFEYIRHDLIVFGLASLAIFTIAFGIIYRRWRFVLIPIICCLLPAVAMLGRLAYNGVPVALVTSNMPVLLFVLMLPYNVYFIERYRERRSREPEESSLDSSMAALRAIFIPCVFSCATTLAGFFALSTSKIIPIRDFGEMMTLGMIVGFVIVFLFLPAVFSRLRPLKVVHNSGSFEPKKSRGLVRVLERATLSKPAVVLFVSLVALLISVEGVRRLSAESKITSYFWPSSEIYQGLEFIDQEFGGTTWIELILTSKDEGFFSRKEGLEAIALAESYFDSVPESGNILSLTKVRDEMRKTVKSEWFPIVPDSLLLKLGRIASPELIGQTANSDFTVGRSTIRMKETSPTLESETYPRRSRPSLWLHIRRYSGR